MLKVATSAYTKPLPRLDKMLSPPRRQQHRCSVSNIYKSLITSAASRARSSKALGRRRGEAGVMSEAVCGEAACHSIIDQLDAQVTWFNR